MTDAAKKPWPAGLDPDRIETKQDFGAQLRLIRDCLPKPVSYQKLAREAFGDSTSASHPNYGTVRYWFTGESVPQRTEPFLRLLTWLIEQAQLFDPPALVTGFERAHDRITSRRSEDQQVRAVQARRTKETVTKQSSAPDAGSQQQIPPEPATAPANEPVRWWRNRKLLISTATLAMLGVLAGIGIATWVAEPPSLLAFAPCAEGVKANPSTAFAVVVQEVGPSGVPDPNRRIEMRTQPAADGWIVWAHLEPSKSPLDRLWLDWSYDDRPADPSRWRQCGPQPITVSAQSPGVLARDDDGHMRWFRACGQVPEQEWLPGRTGSFCTSWSRPPDV